MFSEAIAELSRSLEGQASILRSKNSNKRESGFVMFSFGIDLNIAQLKERSSIALERALRRIESLSSEKFFYFSWKSAAREVILQELSRGGLASLRLQSLIAEDFIEKDLKHM